MKRHTGSAVDWLLPMPSYRQKTLTLFIGAFWLKFIIFDLVWCLNTTFTPFSKPELWIFSIFGALVLSAPAVFTRSGWPLFVLMVAVDVLLVSNLVYFRTYNAAIPLESYTLWENMGDYQNNIYLSLRLSDIFFPAVTAAAVWGFYRLRPRGGGEMNGEASAGRYSRLRYLLAPLTVFIIGYLFQVSDGGFMNSYRTIRQSNKYSCAIPMYTVFGGLYYDAVYRKDEYTAETGDRIRGWISEHEALVTATPMRGRRNVILLLLESFESWTIGINVDGEEITPNLNRLVGDSTVFYAPRVRSQVRGGRSADGKLMIDTGLLPIEQGSYSTQYAGNFFPSYIRAFKEKYPGAPAYVLCVDKPSTWNQGVYWKSFGYDAMIGRSYFEVEDDERTGPKKILGDVPFLRQCAEKIISGEYWDRGGNNCLKVVTYSGHFPFRLPEHLARVSFPSDMPEVMRDYMTTANYTDHAVGTFIEMLTEAGILDNTTLIITGDHEGLADHRDYLARSEAGRDVVATDQFTPLIIVNSDASGRYEPVMGQIDIYPTLLDVLGLEDYPWRGLGFSVFDPAKPPVAITPQLQVAGDPQGVSPECMDHIWRAWEISDLIITHDYFTRGE